MLFGGPKTGFGIKVDFNDSTAEHDVKTAGVGKKKKKVGHAVEIMYGVMYGHHKKKRV